MKGLIIEQPPGTLPTDETFSHSSGPTWNVSLMRRAIRHGNLPARLITAEFTPSFIAALRNVDLNPDRISGFSADELDQPLMTILCRDGLGICVDGNHRAQARVQRGFPTYQTVLIVEPDDHPYRINFLELDIATGEKKPLDPKELAEMGWGTFPQHTPEYQKRRT